jgi:hypothetical protein
MWMANFENLNRASRLWGLVLLLSTLFLSPFYVYASGLPQPAHVIMLVASVALVFLNRDSCIILIKDNLPGVVFLLLISTINITYSIFYKDKEFVISTIYWLYGYLLIFAVLCIARDKWLASWIVRLILIELALIAVAYFIGWGTYTWWPRYEFFFNGPNQLAYFVICLLLVYIAVTHSRFDIGFYIAYAFTIFAVITTGGRSAYLAVVPLVFLLLWQARSRLMHVILLLLIPVALNMIFKPLCLPSFMPSPNGNQRVECQIGAEINDQRIVSNFTMTRIDNLSVKKDVADEKSVWTQLFARGYMRVVQYPQYLLYGAGQGKDERFGEVGGYAYEIHSSPVAVLFYYGVLGFLLFAVFLWKLFSIKKNLLFLTPLLVYGLFTYGLRSPYFWLALGFLAVMPDVLSSRSRSSD